MPNESNAFRVGIEIKMMMKKKKKNDDDKNDFLFCYPHLVRSVVICRFSVWKWSVTMKWNEMKSANENEIKHETAFFSFGIPI